MRGDPLNAEDSWCTSSPKGAIPESTQQHAFDQNRQEQPHLTEVIFALFYGEQREPTEDASDRDEEPDKIEAHRMLMERPKEIVTQNQHTLMVESEARLSNFMLQMANQTLDENEILKKYFSPGTETNNSAMLFLAGTLISSNRYIFDFLHENGVFTPSSQKLVNLLASDFTTQSKQLYKLILISEQSSRAAIKNKLVSCVNDVVATSNQLAKILNHDYDAKNTIVDSTNNISISVLNNIIAKRNQISNFLYDFFQRIVQVETVQDGKSVVSASASSAADILKELGDTECFLADAEEFTTFLYSSLGTENITCGNGVDDIRNTRTTRSDNRQIDAKNNTHIQSDEKAIADPNDNLSTASSFLDFLNESSLSAMFEEDELEITRDTGVAPKEHLNSIFARMNLSIPKQKETISNEEPKDDAIPWGWDQSKIETCSAKEKRRHMALLRSLERQERKNRKNLEKKKARAKESEKDPSKPLSIVGRKSKRLPQGKVGVLLEI
jgi:hypothetical protein